MHLSLAYLENLDFQGVSYGLCSEGYNAAKVLVILSSPLIRVGAVDVYNFLGAGNSSVRFE